MATLGSSGRPRSWFEGDDVDAILPVSKDPSSSLGNGYESHRYRDIIYGDYPREKPKWPYAMPNPASPWRYSSSLRPASSDEAGKPGSASTPEHRPQVESATSTATSKEPRLGSKTVLRRPLPHVKGRPSVPPTSTARNSPHTNRTGALSTDHISSARAEPEDAIYQPLSPGSLSQQDQARISAATTIEGDALKRSRINRQLKKILHSWMMAQGKGLSHSGVQGHATLIGGAILRSPKKRLSAKAICKDIIKHHQWFDQNKHTGWQAEIRTELAQNKCFEPVSIRRLGRATDTVKWRIANSEYDSILARFEASSSNPTDVAAANLRDTMDLREDSPGPLGFLNEEVGTGGVPAHLRRARCLNTVSTRAELPVTTAYHELDANASSTASNLMPSSSATVLPAGKLSVPSVFSDVAMFATKQPSFNCPSPTPNLPALFDDEIDTNTLCSHGSSLNLGSGAHKAWLFNKGKHKKLADDSIVPRIGHRIPSYEESELNRHAGTTTAQAVSSLVPRLTAAFPAGTVNEAASGNDAKNTTASSSNRNELSSQHASSVAPLNSGRQGHQESDQQDENASQDEDSDRDDGRKRKRYQSLNGDDTRPRFACIYHHHDPQFYAENSTHGVRYRTCAGLGWTYISGVVRHLKRVHDDHVCGQCMTFCSRRRDLESHESTCRRPPGLSQSDLWRRLLLEKFPDSDRVDLMTIDLEQPEAYPLQAQRFPGYGERLFMPEMSLTEPGPHLFGTNDALEALAISEADQIRLELSSLAVRVGTLENKLPDIKQAAKSFQDLMLEKSESPVTSIFMQPLLVKSTARSSSSSSSDRGSNCSDSSRHETVTPPSSNGSLTENQILSLIQKGKLRITLAESRQHETMHGSNAGKGKATVSENNVAEPLWADHESLAGSTLHRDDCNLTNAIDTTQVVTKSIDLNMTGLQAMQGTSSYFQNNGLPMDELIGNDLPPAYNPSGASVFVCPLHADLRKTPELCELAEPVNPLIDDAAALDGNATLTSATADNVINWDEIFKLPEDWPRSDLHPSD